MTTDKRKKDLDVSYLRAVGLLIGASFKADPKRTIGSTFLEFIRQCTDIGSLYLMKVVVDSVNAGNTRAAVIAALSCGVGIAVTNAAAMTGSSITVTLRERTLMSLDQRLIRLLTTLPGLEHHERPELLDKIELLRQERWQLGDAVRGLISHSGTFLQASLTMYLLIKIHPVLALLPLSGFFMAYTVKLGSKIENRANEAAASSNRLAEQIDTLVREPDTAPEVRMHRISNLLLRKHAAAHEVVYNARKKSAVKASLWDMLGNAVLTFAQIGSVAFVAFRAVALQGSSGDVLLIVGLVLRMGGQTMQFSYGFKWLLTNLRAVGRLAWLEDEVTKALASSTPSEPAEVPARINQGISLEDVSFFYPGTDKKILDSISVTLPAGKTVALVGENGAGKSTLVKLLCRLYEPTDGAITLDGIDLRRIPIEDWRSRLSGAFQDFAKFDLVAGEVVGVGSVDRVTDREVALEALHRAGAEQIVKRLPQGLDTLLGTSFDTGMEPSGGQWQQLALGRAMMREVPLLLVLDEPTAALDPETEHRLFERYAEQAKAAAAAAGAIAVLVSHRFSTVRMADQIIVLENGCITQSGTHEELIHQPGLYEELFKMQARAYS